MMKARLPFHLSLLILVFAILACGPIARKGIPRDPGPPANQSMTAPSTGSQEKLDNVTHGQDNVAEIRSTVDTTNITTPDSSDVAEDTVQPEGDSEKKILNQLAGVSAIESQPAIQRDAAIQNSSGYLGQPQTLQSVTIAGHSRSRAPSRRKERSNFMDQSVGLLSTSDNEEAQVGPGMLTAGEISDFGKWKMWDDVTNGDLEVYRSRWMMYPIERYCAIVQNHLGAPVPDVQVEMVDKSGEVLWAARTDNTGKAELWRNFFTGMEQAEPAALIATVGGVQTRISDVKPIAEGVNSIVMEAACGISDQVDILFAVDATASMGDEIEYLKKELTDIISKVSADKPMLSIRTGSLFYKCPGNDYVTRPQSFTSDIHTTVNFISQQFASDGGDEAVEQALMEAVHQFEWSPDARARLLFMVLDEPPGNKPNVIPDLQKAMQDAAKKGIRIIPLVSSGVTYDIDKSLEYLMRCLSLGTNGTYTFLTNHSGIGNNHTAPSTDDYDVEKLNALLIRIIDQFTSFPDCPSPEMLEPLVSASDSLLADTTSTEIKVGRKSLNIELFPNPARFEVNIRSEVKLDEIFILDLAGKLLYRFAEAEKLFTLPLDALTNGHYIAKCRIGEEWTNMKFVVSK